MAPGLQVATSPGGQVILQAAHLPTAGALHEAPVSGFFALGFFFSAASAGLHASSAVMKAISRGFIMAPLQGAESWGAVAQQSHRAWLAGILTCVGASLRSSASSQDLSAFSQKRSWVLPS
jgi:hypothetical protein